MVSPSHAHGWLRGRCGADRRIWGHRSFRFWSGDRHPHLHPGGVVAGLVAADLDGAGAVEGVGHPPGLARFDGDPCVTAVLHVVAAAHRTVVALTHLPFVI